jgi:hypothetical protein
LPRLAEADRARILTSPRLGMERLKAQVERLASAG